MPGLEHTGHGPGLRYQVWSSRVTGLAGGEGKGWRGDGEAWGAGVDLARGDYVRGGVGRGGAGRNTHL